MRDYTLKNELLLKYHLNIYSEDFSVISGQQQNQHT